MKKIIELQNIKRNFQVGDETVHALRGISFTIYEGEFVTIMGTSGSGKSTLVNEILYKSLAAALNGARSRPGQCEVVEGMEWVEKLIGIDTRRLAARRAPTRPPTQACLATSARCFPTRRMPKCAATAPGGSASMSRADAAKPAKAAAS